MSGRSTWRYVASTAVVMFAPGLGRVPDDVMAALLADLERHAEVRQLIVYPNAATPTPTQRADVHRWLERRGARVSVLTSDMLVRGVVTALSWFGLPVKAFRCDDLATAPMGR